MPHAELARRPWPVPGEIGADYSRRGPNCNAADRRKPPEEPARMAHVAHSYRVWERAVPTTPGSNYANRLA